MKTITKTFSVFFYTALGFFAFSIIALVFVLLVTPSRASAAVTNFDDHMGNGGYVTPWMVNGILVDFDQDGSACSGTATDYNIFVNSGSVGAESDPYILVQGTSTLMAGHEEHNVLVGDAYVNGFTGATGYFNLQMDYSVGGIVCERENSVGFGAQNWRYGGYTNANWIRNSPDTAQNAGIYPPTQSFDVLMDVDGDTTSGKYPYLATDYQVVGNGFCFPEQVVGADTTYTNTLPSGGYTDLHIVFGTDNSVDGSGCLINLLGFTWPTDPSLGLYDNFTVTGSTPTTTPSTGQPNKQEWAFMFGVICFLLSVPFWDRTLTVTNKAYDV